MESDSEALFLFFMRNVAVGAARMVELPTRRVFVCSASATATRGGSNDFLSTKVVDSVAARVDR